MTAILKIKENDNLLCHYLFFDKINFNQGIN